MMPAPMMRTDPGGDCGMRIADCGMGTTDDGRPTTDGPVAFCRLSSSVCRPPSIPHSTLSRSPDAPAVGIGGVEEEAGFGGDVGAAGDGWDQLAVDHLELAVEDAADDAFLAPDLAGLQLAVGRQAGELGARAGAA